MSLQVRAARAVLGIQVRELAALASVSPTTVVRLEKGLPVQRHVSAAIRRALENSGVRFIDEDAHGGPGIRLRARTEMAPRYNDKEAIEALRAGAEMYVDQHPTCGSSPEALVGSAVIEHGSATKAAEMLYFEQMSFFDLLAESPG